MLQLVLFINSLNEHITLTRSLRYYSFHPHPVFSVKISEIMKCSVTQMHLLHNHGEFLLTLSFDEFPLQ